MTQITLTTARVVRLHLDWMRNRGLTENTVHQRRENLRRLAEALPCDLLDATREDLDEWQTGLRRRLHKATVASYTAHCRAFYRWALDEERIESDPARKLPIPKVPRYTPRPVPEEEFALARACAPEPMLTWILLAGFMGLRCMEIAPIAREDIRAVKSRLILTGIGKGQKSYAMAVPIEVQPYLLRHARTVTSGPLFRYPDGRPITASFVSEAGRRFLHKVGLPYSMHQLRHAFITEFYATCKDPMLTQKAGRWSNMSMLMNYAEVQDDDMLAVLDEMSGSLRSSEAA